MGEKRERYLQRADNARAIITNEDALALEAGTHIIVPKEPTEEMIQAGMDAVDNLYNGNKEDPGFAGSMRAAYKAMTESIKD